MPTFVMDEAVSRFLATAAELDGPAWAHIDARVVAEYTQRRKALLKLIQDAVSATERSALEKRVSDDLRDAAIAASAGGDVRVAPVMDLARVSAFALQKREKVGMDAVRGWFEPFEDVGILVDDVLEEDIR